jgi:hypothetical protein
MRLLSVLALLVAVVACSSDDIADETRQRAVEAVQKYGNSDLTEDQVDEAASELIDTCERSAESFAYKLGTVDSATSSYLDALRYVCPEVFSD